MTSTNLKPRAIAVLVTLRSGPLTTIAIRNSIGDESTASTRDLLGDMRDLKLVTQVRGDDRWFLDHDGLGWLQSNGLNAANGAKAWSHASYDPQAGH